MRHRTAPYIAALCALVLTDVAEARKLTIRQAGAPEVTISVPSGWRAVERRRSTVLTDGRRRVRVVQCGLSRADRDMTGRAAVRRERGNVAIRGGSCLKVSDKRLATRLRPVLGTGGRAPRSDFAAEELARSARARTLAQPRMTGTASAVPFGYDRFVESDFAYEGAYSFQLQRYRWGEVSELVRDPSGDAFRTPGGPCWHQTSTATDDDALEPRLELEDWDAPPSTKTAWHVSYKPIVTLPDRTRLVRWTGFVADGEAAIGPDGLLQRVRIEDHHMARGRAAWRTVEVTFTGFPSTVARVSPQPAC